MSTFYHLRFDADAGPTFHFDADLDPDPTRNFKIGKYLLTMPSQFTLFYT
jgi:hypothetical protein